MKEGKTKFGAILLLAMLVGGLFLWSCSTREVKDPLSITRFNVDQMSNLHGSAGLERSTFYRYETIFLSLEDLYESYETEIDIIHCGQCDTILRRLVVLTDPDGKITNLPIWYHLNTDSLGNVADEAGCYEVLIVQPRADDPWVEFAIPFTIVNNVPPFPFIRPLRVDGTFNGGAVLVGEPVNVTGTGLTAGDSVILRIVPDQKQYAAGDPYVDVTGEPDTVVVQAGGVIPFTEVWNAPASIGSFDIVADLKPFGVFNAGDVINDGLLTGLVVQLPPVPLIDNVMDIACDVNGQFKNVFDELEPIYVSVNPRIRPAELAEPVAIVVTFHRDVWPQGLKLVNIETVGSLHQGTKCYANKFSESLFPILVRGETEADFRHALRLWPGNYDVVMDINRNRMYDPGIDVLDGGTQIGFTVTGTDTAEVQPLVKIILSSWDDLNWREGVEIRSQVVWGLGNTWPDGTPIPDETPVPNALVMFNVAKGPGMVTPTQSMTDENGIAVTIFTGGEWRQWSLIRAVVIIDGIRYTARISQWGKCGCTHNQGIGFGG